MAQVKINNFQFHDFFGFLKSLQFFISRFLQALVGLFELPQDESIPEDERFIEIEETPGYQNSYSKLIFTMGAYSSKVRQTDVIGGVCGTISAFALSKFFVTFKKL